MVELLPATTLDISGNHPTVQMLFPNNDTIFQYDNLPTHIARSVWSWFQEHEDALQHPPWPAQSPALNTTEQLQSVLDSMVKSRFPPPSSLKQLEDVLHGEGYVQYSTRDYMNLWQEA